MTTSNEESWAETRDGAHALYAFALRLVDDGYVRSDRREELLDRARNMRHGSGFLTRAELEERRRIETNQRELEELFR